MSFEWWQWALAGIVLILAELAVPAFVLIWFGLGCLGVALVVAFVGSMTLTVQLATWLGISLTMTAAWFKIFRPGRFKTRIGSADANVIGEIGLLTRDVAPFEKGEVRFQKPILGSEVWICLSEERIGAGTRVKLIGVEGHLLKVARA